MPLPPKLSNAEPATSIVVPAKTVEAEIGVVMTNAGRAMSRAAADSGGYDTGDSRLVLLSPVSSEVDAAANSNIPKSKNDAIALRCLFTIIHIEGIISLQNCPSG
jgi:hypothetical protein